MSLATATAAIRARGDSLWPDIEGDVPLVWQNENGFERERQRRSSAFAWVLVEIRWNGGEYGSIGAPGDNLARRQGHIWVHAFVPQGSGIDKAHRLAAEAAGMFEGQDFSGVLCEAMSPGGDADSEDGLYFGQSAAIPFDFDETA